MTLTLAIIGLGLFGLFIFIKGVVSLLTGLALIYYLFYVQSQVTETDMFLRSLYFVGMAAVFAVAVLKTLKGR